MPAAVRMLLDRIHSWCHAVRDGRHAALPTRDHLPLPALNNGHPDRTSTGLCPCRLVPVPPSAARALHRPAPPRSRAASGACRSQYRLVYPAPRAARSRCYEAGTALIGSGCRRDPSARAALILLTTSLGADRIRCGERCHSRESTSTATPACPHQQSGDAMKVSPRYSRGLYIGSGSLARLIRSRSSASATDRTPSAISRRTLRSLADPRMGPSLSSLTRACGVHRRCCTASATTARTWRRSLSSR